MIKLFKIINVDNQYIKYRFPSFGSDIYLIKWLPYSNTKFHGHNGKQCDYMLIKGNYLNEIRWKSEKSKKTFHKIKPFKIYSINDKMGIHRMSNTHNKVKWSLHRYYMNQL